MTKNIVGLNEEQIARSKQLYGTNILAKEKTKGIVRRFIDNLSDPIIRILLIALGIQVVLTFGHINYIEIFGIVSAIIISAGVSTASEYGSERAFEKMSNDSLDTMVCALRNGLITKIASGEIVVGDIIYLNSGEKIQADGTLIGGKITVDQSALNGESAEISKCSGEDDGWNLSSSHNVFRGSVIIDGSAVMRVGRVGAATYYGMVAKDVQTETRVSPLKLRLGKLASQISKIGYIMAVIVALAYLFSAIVVDNNFEWQKITSYIANYRQMFDLLIHAFTLMITVVVVSAPEGLPMMITVVLSANMKNMLADNILVKKLVGIETAGSMNILFTDKTGTITLGRPQCNNIVTAVGSYKSIGALKNSGDIFRYLNLSAKYNTDVISKSQSIGGNATDRAIFSFFSSERAEPVTVKEKIPFNSERKYSSVTFSNGVTLIKGGAEILLSSVKYALDADGRKIVPDMTRFFEEYRAATSRGERVLAVAMCKENDLTNITLIALIMMKDKIRPGVKDAVERVKGAGIQTVMITGDSKDTAIAIAMECNIMSNSGFNIALSGEELRAMSDEQVKEILPRLRVVARALPQDKTRLVRLSQELELVVGMTGDGINDSPSLKLSDVGFAMGSGTDIAKSAADIVIVDDSFTAISKTILYGRTIFKSIRKFITFQLVMNLAACGISLIGQLIGVDTPITIIQMLWVNIIMDTLGGLAFAGEAPEEYYMREKPKKRDEPILSSNMLWQILFCGAFTLGICIIFLTSPTIKMIYSDATKFYTAFYALFIFSGIFNCFIARCERMWFLANISKNKYFILIMSAISVIQICMIYFGGEVFRCAPLSIRELWLAISLAMAIIPFDIARRVLVRLK